jgi:hypothetical protein
VASAKMKRSCKRTSTTSTWMSMKISKSIFNFDEFVQYMILTAIPLPVGMGVLKSSMFAATSETTCSATSTSSTRHLSLPAPTLSLLQTP